MGWSAMTKKQLLALLVILILVLVGLHFVRLLILGDVNVPSFKPTPEEASISAMLQKSGSPVKDFDVTKDVLVSPGWHVVWIRPVGSYADLGVVVVKDVGGIYTVELGPGNQFFQASIQQLPPSVQYYLYTQNLVHAGVN